MTYQYDAFISYRHHAVDSAVAAEIQHRLEHFRIPRAIQKATGVRKISRIFRDKAELAITSDINEDMEYLEDLCIGDIDDDDEGYDEVDVEDDADVPCTGCCGSCGDEQEYEVTCPKCGETITVFEEDLDFGSIRCPKCDAELEFDMSSDDGEDK